MDVLKEILTWSSTLPQWQSDAVRRLLTQGQLTPTDESELLALAEHASGLRDAAPTQAARPLVEADLPAQTPTGTAPTILVSMQGVKNVNKLAQGQTLSFGPSITVIYGGNGTGKSGYARVLKRACRARDAGGPILADVTAAAAAGPAEATLSITGPATSTLSWKDGQPTPVELAQISVLDGECARLFIDEASAVAYAPYGLDVFPKLAQLFGALKTKLDAQVAQHSSRDSALDLLAGDHAVGQLIAALTAMTTTAQVDALATGTPAETQKLTLLEQQRAELKANDPLKQAEAFRRLKRRVATQREQMQREAASLGATKVKDLKDAVSAHAVAGQAALQASTQQFQAEALPGVGGEAWKLMFRAAAVYSTTAYPGHAFPHTGDGSRCVLCQQELDGDAKERMQRFWKFLEDQTAQELQRAKVSLDSQTQALTRLTFAKTDAELVKEISDHNTALSAQVAGHAAGMAALRDAALAAVTSGQWDTLPTPDVSGTETLLLALETSLEEDALKKIALAKPEETAKLEKEYVELDARRRLAQSRQAVLGEIDRLTRLSKLTVCIGGLRTTDISKKGKELTDQALTTSLQAALTEELKKLEMHFDLNFKPTAKDGQTRHQLHMPTAKPPKGVALSDVLSEGEQHVIGLAAFLAELRMAGGSNGIVFDDPVSSLDHRWMERTAKRLVEEGAKRQVVIFTHNISFVVAIKQLAGEAQIPLQVQWLRRVNNVPGHSSNELPWEILSAKKRLKALTDIALEARAAHALDSEGEAYQRLHGLFYDRLRATWERTVEEVVLGQVVLRFRKGVETKRLEGVVLEDPDYKTIYDAMSLGSDETPAHDHAAELLHELKTPTELDGAIKHLRAFVEGLEAKQEAAKKRRKALVAPPTAPPAAAAPTPAP